MKYIRQLFTKHITTKNIAKKCEVLENTSICTWTFGESSDLGFFDAGGAATEEETEFWLDSMTEKKMLKIV
jgi:hypothetical protein